MSDDRSETKRFWEKPAGPFVRVAGYIFVAVIALSLIYILYIAIFVLVQPKAPTERNEVIRTVAQIVGGVVVAIGGFFTWRNLRVAERNQQINLDTQAENQRANTRREDLTQEAQRENEKANRKREEQADRAQLTARFTQAVEQLSSDYIEIRLGGIYTLERLLKESPSDYRPIIEVLTAFLRDRARWGANSLAVQEEPSVEPGQPVLKPQANYFKQATDTLAIISVLSRRDPPSEQENLPPIDLSGTDLRGAHFFGHHYEEWNFHHAHLDRSHFVDFACPNLYCAEGSFDNVLFRGQCNFGSMYFRKTSMVAIIFGDTKIGNLSISDRCDLHDADLGTIMVERASLRGALNLELEDVNPVYWGLRVIRWPEYLRDELRNRRQHFDSLGLSEKQDEAVSGATSTNPDDSQPPN